MEHWRERLSLPSSCVITCFITLDKKAAMTKKRGLYVSYDENKNGPFDEAVRISNERGCVTWFDNFPLNPEESFCPTEIFIRLTGKETYFRGTLLAIAPSAK